MSSSSFWKIVKIPENASALPGFLLLINTDDRRWHANTVSYLSFLTLSIFMLYEQYPSSLDEDCKTVWFF